MLSFKTKATSRSRRFAIFAIGVVLEKTHRLRIGREHVSFYEVNLALCAFNNTIESQTFVIKMEKIKY